MGQEITWPGRVTNTSKFGVVGSGNRITEEGRNQITQDPNNSKFGVVGKLVTEDHRGRKKPDYTGP